MKGPIVMILCTAVANTICNALITGKISKIEKNKKDTPYDVVYQMVYPLIGIGIGTILACLIKWA